MKIFLLFLLLFLCTAFIDALMDVLMGTKWSIAVANVCHPFDVIEAGDYVFISILLFISIIVPLTSYLKEKRQ